MLVLLTGLGFLGNYFRIPLFFGADFLLGSIAGLVIVSLYGWRWGFLANFVISGYTYFLWGHPYAVITFSSEALFVGLFLRFRKENLLVGDAWFWLLLGMPAGWLFYGVALGTGATGTTFIVLKQAANGIFNALFASLAINHIPFHSILGWSYARKSISLRESLFNLLVALVLIPSFLIVIQNGRKQMAQIEDDAISELPKITADVTAHLQSWYQTRLHAANLLAATAGKSGMVRSEGLQHDTELIKKGFPDFQAMYVADAEGTTLAYEPAVNEKAESTIGLNFADRPYFKQTKLTGQPTLSEVFLGRGGVSSPVVVLSVPVVEEGRMVGLVATALDLDRIRRILQSFGKDRGVDLTLVDAEDRVIATTASGREAMQAFDRGQGWDRRPVGSSVYQWFPRDEKYQMLRWRKSFYVQEQRISAEIPWTLVLESPVAPLQQQLHSIYVYGFSTMAVVAFLALLLAQIFQRWPSRPLEELAQVATDLPRKLTTAQEIDWPKSSVAEIQFLIANFRSMADALRQNFQELSAQTTELASTNEQLRMEIDERKHTQETLNETTNVLQELIQASPLAIVALDRDRKVKVWNHAAEQLFGWSEAEVVGHPPPSVAEDQYEAFRQTVDDQLQGRSVVAQELRRQRRDGSRLDVSIWTAPLRDAQGQVVGAIELFADISETKRNQDALRESQAKFQKLYQEFQALLDGLPDEIALLSPEFEVIWANHSMATRFGKDSKELIGSHCYGLWDHGEKPCAICPAQTTFRTNEPASAFISTLDGRTRESRSVPVRDDSGRVLNVIEVVRDITEQRKLERQLQQAQKMEAIGTLAGGIAHDFNNILGIISGYTELIQMEEGIADDFKSNLQEVLRACMRAKDLVKQILTFSRQSEQERRPFQIGLNVKEALKLLRASLPTTIEIRQEIESNGIVVADSTQIHQVIMNLCTNAQHAMRDKGGVLEVSLTDVELDLSSIADHPDLHPGRYLRLTVSDTGHGINPSIMERIFDPFFTTKGPGDGTGLGLAVVHGIVSNLDGAIEVHSQLGNGTTFDVYLPRADAESDDKVDASVRRLPTGSERVLLVDDEEALASIGRQMLERLGYGVTTTTKSLEALELFKKHPGRFDLVITDLNMPIMTGLALAQELSAIRPGIPIILCTGLSEVPTEEKARAIGIRKILMKPVELERFSVAIREVFETRSGSVEMGGAATELLQQCV